VPPRRQHEADVTPFHYGEILPASATNCLKRDRHR